MSEPRKPKRDAKGHYLPGESGWPRALPRDVLSERAIKAFRRVEVNGWAGNLPEGFREAVEARVMELTRSRFSDLTPAMQSSVRAIARDEILEAALEGEAFTSKRKLVDRRSGKVRPWLEVLIRLRENLDKRRARLDEALKELEPKRVEDFEAYVTARDRGQEPESVSPPDALAASESCVLDVAESPGRPVQSNASSNALPPVSAVSLCAECGSEFAGRKVNGFERRFCSPSCRNRAWRREHRVAHRDDGNRDG
jgi:hypothetical protein